MNDVTDNFLTTSLKDYEKQLTLSVVELNGFSRSASLDALIH